RDNYGAGYGIAVGNTSTSVEKIWLMPPRSVSNSNTRKYATYPAPGIGTCPMYVLFPVSATGVYDHVGAGPCVLRKSRTGEVALNSAANTGVSLVVAVMTPLLSIDQLTCGAEVC